MYAGVVWCRGINNRKKGPPCCRAAMWVRRGSLRTGGDWWGAPGRAPEHQPQRHTFTARLPAHSPPAPLQHHTAWRSLNDLHVTLVFLGLTNLQGLPRETLVGPSVGWFLCAAFSHMCYSLFCFTFGFLLWALLTIWLSDTGLTGDQPAATQKLPWKKIFFFLVSVSDIASSYCSRSWGVEIVLSVFKTNIQYEQASPGVSNLFLGRVVP